jgi:hypothetical protein
MYNNEIINAGEAASYFGTNTGTEIVSLVNPSQFPILGPGNYFISYGAATSYNGNPVVFSDDASFDASGSKFFVGPTTGPYTTVSGDLGFQIIGGVPGVPEPSTWVLMMIGACLFRSSLSAPKRHRQAIRSMLSRTAD